MKRSHQSHRSRVFDFMFTIVNVIIIAVVALVGGTSKNPTTEPTTAPTATPTSAPTAAPTQPTFAPTSSVDACGPNGVCICYTRYQEKIVDCSQNSPGLNEIPNLPLDTAWLLFQNNNIDEIGINNTFGSVPLTQLKNLYLFNMPSLSGITVDAFTNVPNVETLLLHFTGIQILPSGLINGLTKLKWFWMNDGIPGLEYIEPGAFVGLHNLRELFLQNNNLSSLNHVDFSSQKALKHFKTFGNNALMTPSCCTLCNFPSYVDVTWGTASGAMICGEDLK